MPDLIVSGDELIKKFQSAIKQLEKFSSVSDQDQEFKNQIDALKYAVNIAYKLGDESEAEEQKNIREFLTKFSEAMQSITTAKAGIHSSSAEEIDKCIRLVIEASQKCQTIWDRAEKHVSRLAYCLGVLVGIVVGLIVGTVGGFFLGFFCGVYLLFGSDSSSIETGMVDDVRFISYFLVACGVIGSVAGVIIGIAWGIQEIPIFMHDGCRRFLKQGQTIHDVITSIFQKNKLFQEGILNIGLQDSVGKVTGLPSVVCNIIADYTQKPAESATSEVKPAKLPLVS